MEYNNMNNINGILFLSRAPTRHSFTFNLRFLYELQHKTLHYKSICGIFHFRFCFFLCLVCSTESMESFTLICHNSFQYQNNKKATHTFAPRPQIFNCSQKFLSCNKKF